MHQDVAYMHPKEVTCIWEGLRTLYCSDHQGCGGGGEISAEVDSSRVDEEMEWLTEAFTCCETKARPGRTSIVVEAQRATPPARVGVGIAFDSEG